jgi:hypothetical protein
MSPSARCNPRIALALALFGLGATPAFAGPLPDEPARNPAPVPAQSPRPAQSTLTLSPAVVMVKGKPGQGWTQSFQMTNFTSATLAFEIEVQDVVVKDGKRNFVAAGETERGIAATAVATPRDVVIAPQQTGSVRVTVTLPLQTSQRAVVVYFRSRLRAPSEGGSVGLGASLGGLITFTLSEDYNVQAAAFSTTPQTDTSDLTISHVLVNSGREPVIPKGSAAILDEQGKRVSRSSFKPQRLLPGESLAFTAENPNQLKPGRYRVVSSFEYEGRIMTAAGQFVVP